MNGKSSLRRFEMRVIEFLRSLQFFPLTCFHQVEGGGLKHEKEYLSRLQGFHWAKVLKETRVQSLRTDRLTVGIRCAGASQPTYRWNLMKTPLAANCLKERPSGLRHGRTLFKLCRSPWPVVDSLDSHCGDRKSTRLNS